jgi:hypothetical protein
MAKYCSMCSTQPPGRALWRVYSYELWKSEVKCLLFLVPRIIIIWLHGYAAKSERTDLQLGAPIGRITFSRWYVNGKYMNHNMRNIVENNGKERDITPYSDQANYRDRKGVRKNNTRFMWKSTVSSLINQAREIWKCITLGLKSSWQRCDECCILGCDAM